MRISSNMLPQRAAYFSDDPTRNHRSWLAARPRGAVCALLKTRNRLHTIHPAPSPPDAGRYTVPSRFRCQSGDCGYRVRGLCTEGYLPAHPRRILLMEQQVWSIHMPDNQPCDLVSQCHLKKVMHRGWAYFQAHLAFTMAAFNVLVQWHGFQPNASGFVPLSIAEFSL